MTPSRAAVLLLAGLVATGCLPHAPVPAWDQGGWPEQRDAVTRRADIYDGFEHRADVWSVRLTRAVREERLRRVAAWQHWSQAELDAKLAAEREEAAKWDDFVILFYTADKKWNDLDATQSIWRLVFEMGGGDEVVGKAQSLERNATFEALYPMGGPFDVAYRVRFRRDDNEPTPRPGVLRIASALGELRLPYTPGSKPVPAPSPTP